MLNIISKSHPTSSNAQSSHTTSSILPTQAERVYNKEIKHTIPWVQITLILYLYCISFLGITLYMQDWVNFLYVPRTLVWMIGSIGFLVISISLWIFGYIQHTVKLSLIDVLIIFLGVSIGIMSFIHPNDIAFWGELGRLFDSGWMWIFLTILYGLIRIVLTQKSLESVLYGYALMIYGIVGLSLIVSMISLGELPSITSILQNTFFVITDSAQELLFIVIMSQYTIFMRVYQNEYKSSLSRYIEYGIYLLSIIILVYISIRIPSIPMQALSIGSLIIQTIYYTRYSLNKQKSSALYVMRLTFLGGIFILGAIILMIIRPLGVFTLTVLPNINASQGIVENTLQDNIILGSGAVQYAWAQYMPTELLTTTLWNSSFLSLYNEFFGLIVRYGGIILMILSLIGLWVIGSIVRVIGIQKVFPVEIFVMILMSIGFILIPFSLITKVFIIFIYALWAHIIMKYFRPIVTLDLSLSRIPPQLASLFTFIVIGVLSGGLILAYPIIGIIRSEVILSQVNQETDLSNSQLLDKLNLARSYSPQIIDYAQLSIPGIIAQIDRDTRQIFENQSEDTQLNESQIEQIQSRIGQTQEIIDDYTRRFPDDERIVFWQISLYALIHRYGDIDKNQYLASINRGRELRPSSPFWDMYEAQYYLRQRSKSESPDAESLNQSIELLKSSIAKKSDFVDAYLTYYDVYGQSRDYEGQIALLNQYVNAVNQLGGVADVEVIYALGIAYQNNTQYVEAEQIYQKIISDFPEYTNAYFKLGEIYEVQKRIPEAIVQYQKVLELDNNAEEAQKKIDILQ
jgi:tetratricopeptide (TPR) repeat protein